MLERALVLTPWDATLEMAWRDELESRTDVDFLAHRVMMRTEITRRVEDMVTAHGGRARAIRSAIRAAAAGADRVLVPVVVYTDKSTHIAPHIAYVTVRDVRQALRFDRHAESRYGRLIRHRVGQLAECIAVGVDWLLAHPEILMVE